MGESNRERPSVKEAVFRSAAAASCIAEMAVVVARMQHVHAGLFYTAIGLSIALLVACAMTGLVKGALLKLVALIAFVTLAVTVCYCAAYSTGLLEKIGSFEELKATINSAGKWGWAVLFVITLLSVIVLPIPSALTVALGVLLYGSTVSFLISAAGTIVGSIICFFLGRVFGFRLAEWVAGKEKAQKYAEIIGENGKLSFAVMLLFPFFPDDILCILAGVTKMSFRFFIITVLLTRPVMLAFYSYFGTGKIIPFKGWGIPIWITIFALSVAAIYLAHYLIKKRSEKKKSSDDNKPQEGK